ncbi:hypothetical protein VB776_07915 [Arcicella sp. DC2W]|uniref:Uncharacterized protein n=1 Tax=Arcicella gelida TaxID=2984195 RepID=A0ABU5S364_9BACT|nr:hypothetical protein [Arcicella sp. DC2W]MEA5402836.1 hypothetical protein [Arcicella sp. DC2W]
MKKIITLLTIAIFPFIGFAQEKIAGQFMSETVTISTGQQIGQQGAGTISTISRSYLTVQGKKYKLYRFSKDQIASMIRPNNGQQQVQQPLSVINEDYYLVGNQQENGKYCLILGIIDKENRIIYSATLIEVFDESKITEALNKCGYEK